MRGTGCKGHAWLVHTTFAFVDHWKTLHMLVVSACYVWCRLHGTCIGFYNIDAAPAGCFRVKLFVASPLSLVFASGEFHRIPQMRKHHQPSDPEKTESRLPPPLLCASSKGPSTGAAESHTCACGAQQNRMRRTAKIAWHTARGTVSAASHSAKSHIGEQTNWRLNKSDGAGPVGLTR